MPVWKMSAVDYARIKASERHHFIHENATTHTADRVHYHMTFSVNVAAMLRAELGVALDPVMVRDDRGNHRPHDHPAGAIMVPPDELRATALNAPGFNPPEPTA